MNSFDMFFQVEDFEDMFVISQLLEDVLEAERED